MNRNTENKNTIIEQCLISLAENKLEAMDRLYETISKDVYAFAISKVRDKFDAEDITQDTFIRVYENAKLYTPIGKPLAWIFTIETNVINRYFNLKNRNNNIEDESILEQVEDSSNIDESKEIKNDYLRNKSIDECTKLFDINSFDNPQKASTYIYKAFENDFNSNIDETLKDNVSRINLLDMLTFDRVDFEKNINCTVKNRFC